MSFPRLRAFARLIRGRLPIADRAGSVAVISAIVFSVLLGFAGLAIDAASWEETAQRAQTAADQAALAAGMADLDGEDLTGAGQAVAAANGFVDGANGATVTVNPLPDNSSDIEVVVSQQTNSEFFVAMAPTVARRAVANESTGACLILLGTSGTTFQSTSASGGMNLDGCDYYNNSFSSEGTQITGGYKIGAEDIYLSGNYQVTGSGSVTATKSLVTKSPAVPDPYASKAVPSYSGCTAQGSSYSHTGSNASISFTDIGSPTVICGNVTETGSGGTMNFSNGVYIFKNSIDITGSSWTINSTNATLIFTGSSGITMTGSATFNLTAPTLKTGGDTAQTAGMALWEAKGDTSGLTLTGSSTLNVNGVVYMPSGGLTITGTGTAACTQFVVSKITATGTSNLKHDCKGYGVADPGGGVTLVE